MSSPRGKRVAVLVVVGAVLAVVTASIASRRFIAEKYWLWRLERGDEAEANVAFDRLSDIYAGRPYRIRSHRYSMLFLNRNVMETHPRLVPGGEERVQGTIKGKP